MKTIILLSAMMTVASAVWAKGAEDKSLPADEAGRCRYGAEHMIEFAKQTLSGETGHSERVEKRRKLIEEWTSRLKKGEDPCRVYMDIQKAATSF